MMEQKFPQLTENSTDQNKGLCKKTFWSVNFLKSIRWKKLLSVGSLIFVSHFWLVHFFYITVQISKLFDFIINGFSCLDCALNKLVDGL